MKPAYAILSILVFVLLPVRASMGLATFPHDAQTPHDIIRQADEMMYVVKNTTRDNIGVASRGMVET